MLALVLIGVGFGMLALIAPEAIGRVAEETLRGISERCENWRNDCLDRTGRLRDWMRMEARFRTPDATKGEASILRFVVGIVVTNGVALATLAADSGLLALTMATMLEVDLPEGADWWVLALTTASAVGALIFWGMAVVESLGWSQPGFGLWPQGRAAFVVLSVTMFALSVVLIVVAAIYRDRLLSTGVGASEEVLSGVASLQTWMLAGLAALSAVTAAVALMSVGPLITIVLAAVVFAGGAVALIAFAAVLIATQSFAVGAAGIIAALHTTMRAQRMERAVRRQRQREAQERPRTHGTSTNGAADGDVGIRSSRPWRRRSVR